MTELSDFAIENLLDTLNSIKKALWDISEMLERIHYMQVHDEPRDDVI